jgi:hypothetical protein
MTDKSKNNGGATDYYNIPEGSTTLNDLIEAKNMNFAVGNIFKACYRLGEKDSAKVEYDLNKIIYYAQRELERRKKLGPEAVYTLYASSTTK